MKETVTIAITSLLGYTIAKHTKQDPTIGLILGTTAGNVINNIREAKNQIAGLKGGNEPFTEYEVVD